MKLISAGHGRIFLFFYAMLYFFDEPNNNHLFLLEMNLTLL